MLAVVSVLFQMDYASEAVTVLIGYDCGLRTVEFCCVRSGGIIVTTQSVFVYLGITKTGHKDARIDSIEILDNKYKSCSGGTCVNLTAKTHRSSRTVTSFAD